MAFLAALWLPIVLSAVLVFVVSSVIHMCLPIHKGDHRQLPNEDLVLESLRAQGVGPGEYSFPWVTSMKEMGSEASLERYRNGPVGFMSIVPNGPPRIGTSLIQWFLFTVVVSVFIAYLSSLARPFGAPYLEVFQVAGATAFLAYGFSNAMNSIWKGSAWAVTARFAFDGLLYALTTAGTFAWLWPAA